MMIFNIFYRKSKLYRGTLLNLSGFFTTKEVSFKVCYN
jgi:hypothetical protein